MVWDEDWGGGGGGGVGGGGGGGESLGGGPDPDPLCYGAQWVQVLLRSSSHGYGAGGWGGGMWGRQAWRNPTDTLGRAGGHHAGQHRAGVGVLGCSLVQPGLSWAVEDTEMRFCTQK